MAGRWEANYSGFIDLLLNIFIISCLVVFILSTTGWILPRVIKVFMEVNQSVRAKDVEAALSTSNLLFSVAIAAKFIGFTTDNPA